MPPLDIHTVIAELAGLYDDLNGRWANDTCETDIYQVFRQREYRETYERLKETNIESVVLKIVADAVSDNVLSRLRELISKNVRIYETRLDDFNSIGFDKLYQLWEDSLFADKRAILLKDRETITDYPYPTEQERQLHLEEIRREINELDKERHALRREDALWIGMNYYLAIYDLSRSFAAILASYFPGEDGSKATAIEDTAKPDGPDAAPEQTKVINPNGIFRSKMFDRLLVLEARLIKNAYLDTDLNWLPRHKNNKPDIKRLVTFMTGLLDNNYFLPNRDAAIKAFFEARYHTSIGQNFERKRREPLLNDYKTVFFEYPF